MGYGARHMWEDQSISCSSLSVCLWFKINRGCACCYTFVAWKPSLARRAKAQDTARFAASRSLPRLK